MGVTADSYDADIRRAVYHLLFVPMLRLPDEAFLEQIQSEEFREALAAIGRAVPIPLMAEGLALVENYVEALAKGRENEEDYRALVDGLARDRTYLFRALAPDVGAPPPYETQYRNHLTREAGIGEMTDVYRAAGMEVGDEVHERPDYLGVELAFMTRLIEAELDAGTEALEGLRESQAAFFFDHLGQWAPDYVSDALGHARTDFFIGVLKVAQALFERESTYLEPYAR